MDRTEACFQLAREAAEILAAQRGTARTSYKGDRDPVTEADRASERFLISELLGRFPGDGFLGEEGAQETSRSGYLWIADPLDGTVNFSHGHPYYGVSLALLKDGRVVAGAVVHGETFESFQAERGSGAYRGSKRLRVSEIVELRRALASTDFAYALEHRLGRGMKRVEAILATCEALRVRGSAALELCRVAAGELEIFAGDNTYAWDVAAGQLILEEAGGRLSTWTGEAFDPLEDPRFPLASNGFLHAQALEMASRF